jgi:hypothetical protein
MKVICATSTNTSKEDGLLAADGDDRSRFLARAAHLDPAVPRGPQGEGEGAVRSDAGVHAEGEGLLERGELFVVAVGRVHLPMGANGSIGRWPRALEAGFVDDFVAIHRPADGEEALAAGRLRRGRSGEQQERRDPAHPIHLPRVLGDEVKILRQLAVDSAAWGPG